MKWYYVGDDTDGKAIETFPPGNFDIDMMDFYHNGFYFQVREDLR
jgi:hypothetical protein